MNLSEIAAKISAHLNRIEESHKELGWYCARSYVRGRYVAVMYKSYQGASNLTKDEAIAYLDWLDAGNDTAHHKCTVSLELRRQRNNHATEVWTAKRRAELEAIQKAEQERRDRKLACIVKVLQRNEKMSHEKLAAEILEEVDSFDLDSC